MMIAQGELPKEALLVSESGARSPHRCLDPPPHNTTFRFTTLVRSTITHTSTLFILSLLTLTLIQSVHIATSQLQEQHPTQANSKHQLQPNDHKQQVYDVQELDLATADSNQNAQTYSSHEILASGWPSTSAMWPSIETETSGGSDAGANQTPQVEPFIYADKPAKQDYSLLLSLNQTLVELLKTMAKQSQQLGVNLSFECYFNHEPQKVTALPGIKIEVDRKEFDYLEPNYNSATSQDSPVKRPIKTKMWIKYNRKIALTDAVQLDKPDWLKLSLVNRESPSLVAIRKLRVEFVSGDSPSPSFSFDGQQGDTTTPASTNGLVVQPTTSPPPPSTTSTPPPPPSPSPSPSPPPPPPTTTISAPDYTASPQRPTYTKRPTKTEGGRDGETYGERTGGSSRGDEGRFGGGDEGRFGGGDEGRFGGGDEGRFGGRDEGRFGGDEGRFGKRGGGREEGRFGGRGGRRGGQRGAQPLPQPPQSTVTESQPEVDLTGTEGPDEASPGDYQIPQESNVLTSTIKPVEPTKNKGWFSSVPILGNGRRRRKRQSNDCEHWKTDQAAGQIHWSLARMPPSTQAIQFGYFYVSNRNNYGDLSKPLMLYLNQTETATIADLSAHHCLDLALYVTERTHLRLYKAMRQNRTAADPTADVEQPPEWVKSSQLLEWAPTTTDDNKRPHLEGAQMAAANQSGWTLETLCFGDFFELGRKCGLGECAFAFEMVDGSRAESRSEFDSADVASSKEQSPGSPASMEEATNKEQVVGVALLRQFAVSIHYQHNKQARPAKWLETWHRQEVEPEDNWRFYPKLDYTLQRDGVSLVNLYHETQYSIQSDWLLASEHLNFEASFLIELLDLDSPPQSSTLNPPQTVDMQPEQRQGFEEVEQSDRVFSLFLKRRIVDEHFATMHSLNSTLDWYQHYNNSTRLALFNMSVPDLGEFVLGRNDARDAHYDQQPDLREQLMPIVQPTQQEPRFFKIVIDIVLEIGSSLQHLSGAGAFSPRFRLTLANVSLADRCWPSPCHFGVCQQNGTGFEDWQCQCDQQHRGRRCEFGRWCQLAHVAPPSVTSSAMAAVSPVPGASGSVSSPNLNSKDTQDKQQQKRQLDNQLIILKTQTPTSSPSSTTQSSNNKLTLNPKADLAPSSQTTRLTGKEFCQRKLGTGSKCSDLDLVLNLDRLYLDENETFTCSCQEDFYLSDDGKCTQAHQCNSIVCPFIGQICDESRPFNRTQPCHCNEKQDWYPVSDSTGPQDSGGPKCVRHQCHDKKRDCGFEAHICLPTLPGERPVCKCGPKFALKANDKTGQKWCQSTACNLPTLNDCEHICLPNDHDLQRPYTCACHEGFVLDKDAKSCSPSSTTAHAQTHQHLEPQCQPACDKETQICTDLGCRCRQGYVAEGERTVQISAPLSSSGSSRNSTVGQAVNYVRSVRCLNVCTLTYAENKSVFERIESVCPLGLCDPVTFNCRCSDPHSTALVNTKYEPIWSNETYTSTSQAPSSEEDAGAEGEDEQQQEAADKKRASPLCHLKRVCRRNSAAYKLCRARDAICVPDYTKPAMFDCVCPPSSEKRLIGQAGDFQCEPRCGSIKQECLKRQAQCRPIDTNQVRCDCLPGMMLDRHDERCYLAHYTYSMNLIVVNKYYEPESRYHKQVALGQPNGTATAGEAVGEPDDPTQPLLHELAPEFQRASRLLETSASHQPKRQQQVFIADYNQCNITQLLPKDILEDPYEHNMGTFLQYMEQCNEKIHQSSRRNSLNSRLAEDLRQSMRQHLVDFTVTTNSSLCEEVPRKAATPDQHQDGISYLNCTVFLQSMRPVEEATIRHVFSNCDRHGVDERLCWVKPRLLLLKQGGVTSLELSPNSSSAAGQLQNPFVFRQVVPCELEGFCGPDALSLRLDTRTSLCSCKCPQDIEMVDLKELEPRARNLVPLIPTSALNAADGGFVSPTTTASRSAYHHWQAAFNSVQQERLAHGAVKEICAPRNLCGQNSTFCALKTGSVCQYDIRTGSRCNCVYPSYEDNEGRCVEITFSQLDTTLIVIIILLGTCLLVSIVLNLYALAKSKRGLFSRSKQYPLSEFSQASSVGGNKNNGQARGSANNHAASTGRPLNRSTGMPNLAFDPHD